MARLISGGTNPRAYMAYTAMISQLAQKYKWASVIRFDREYRQLQANIGFMWGKDFASLRDCHLIPLTPFGQKQFGVAGAAAGGAQKDELKGARSGSRTPIKKKSAQVFVITLIRAHADARHASFFIFVSNVGQRTMVSPLTQTHSPVPEYRFEGGDLG